MVTELDRKLELKETEERGYKKGEAKGEAKGRAEAVRETAANLKKLGISVSDIAKATGLSEAEIQNL